MSKFEEWIISKETESIENRDFVPLFNEEDLRELSDIFDKED